MGCSTSTHRTLNTPTLTKETFQPSKVKLLFVGDASVGKSSIILRYVDDAFSNLPSTIGVDFKTVTVDMEGKEILLEIWDTAGQERFRTVVASYYRNANGYILVFDVTRRETFDNLDYWINQLTENSPSEDSFILIIGNKVDLEADREVSEDEAREFVTSRLCNYIECSAKQNINIDHIFTLALNITVQRKGL
eukprot:TRINITY_DN6308_c0_g1_i1.p1 TRINITY_DN6308_c0_g1~~TRINITY_DN6308_c0_g1_i1.p1  ORF type:complete len:193 (-),score=32.86 TRINITY_DN6308_c0_g1_i1:8-586(-)